MEQEVLVPMIFVQQEQMSTIKTDILEKNSYLLDATLNARLNDINKIIFDHETLINIFIESKDDVTAEIIIDYIN